MFSDVCMVSSVYLNARLNRPKTWIWTFFLPVVLTLFLCHRLHLVYTNMCKRSNRGWAPSVKDWNNPASLLQTHTHSTCHSSSWLVSSSSYTKSSSLPNIRDSSWVLYKCIPYYSCSIHGQLIWHSFPKKSLFQNIHPSSMGKLGFLFTHLARELTVFSECIFFCFCCIGPELTTSYIFFMKKLMNIIIQGISLHWF